jgi:magnesium-transporting ATPase (P-type)
MTRTNPCQLMQLMESKDASELEKYGGVNSLALSLGSDSQAGLSSTSDDALKKQRKYYGENVWERKPPPTVWGLFLEALQDSTLIILLVAAGLNLNPDFLNHFHCWQPNNHSMTAASIGAGAAQCGIGGNTCAAKPLWAPADESGTVREVLCEM